MENNESQDYRKGFEEAVANMFATNGSKYVDYLFYAHILSQCRVHFDTNLPSIAGVNFTYDHFNLYINPNDIDLKRPDGSYPIDSKTGKEVKFVSGFNSLPLERRLGVLKHEMLHIIENHITRREDRDPDRFNISADCAINQFINKCHLPEYAITPENFPVPPGTIVPEKQTSEQYYDLLSMQSNDSEDGDSPSFKDSHSKWEESKGSKELQKDIAKALLQKAIAETQKSRGALPSEISTWLELLSNDREVNWRQLFRKLVGNKKANIKKTIMRPDRRMPELTWVKGRTKNRIGVPVIVGDESGSVSNTELTYAIGECLHICKLLNTDLWYVPVDLEAHTPHILTSNQKTFERKASGGTVLSPAIQKIKEANIEMSALVVITDGYISEDDIAAFANTKKQVIMLITSNGIVPEEAHDYENIKPFKLKPLKA